MIRHPGLNRHLQKPTRRQRPEHHGLHSNLSLKVVRSPLLKTFAGRAVFVAFSGWNQGIRAPVSHAKCNLEFVWGK